ncbi:MAG TPA: cupin-like domain-containing protein, partial [Rudaea sp.]|nr:cupin-like domain-containing protein [Rudaea sp.]
LVPQRLFAGVNNLEIFFGGAGGRFPYLHYDVMHLHAWITQLYGEKEFVLYAPGQEQFLYPRPDLPWQSSIRNHHAPDYARYPLLLNARAQKIVLRPGETLFLPCGWWHTARSLGVTISIAFDQLGPDNWDDFRNDVVAERRNAGHAIKASLLDTYLRVVDVALAIGERFGAGRRATWGTR